MLVILEYSAGENLTGRGEFTVAAFHYQPAITSTCGPRQKNIG